MNVIYKLNQEQIKDLHCLFQLEWWSKGRSFEDTKKCVESSQICIALVDDAGKLQAFCRILTDCTFKAIIFDVIVAKNQRGIGIGDKLISLIKNHQKLNAVKHFELHCLPEMFSFYKKYGFSSNTNGLQLMRYANI